jgi:hypothetical protein
MRVDFCREEGTELEWTMSWGPKRNTMRIQLHTTKGNSPATFAVWGALKILVAFEYVLSISIFSLAYAEGR